MRNQKLIITILIIFALSFTSLSYTFYVKDNTYITTLDTKAFELTVEIKLGEVALDPTSLYFSDEKQAYMINLYDEQAENYINNFTLKIKTDVSIASRLRFRLHESYELTRYYHNQEQTILKEIIYMDAQDDTQHPFSLLKKGEFQNYFLSDYHYSYFDQLISQNQIQIFDLIAGGASYEVRENSLYHETCVLYLAYEFEVVQANRYSQVWGVDSTLFDH